MINSKVSRVLYPDFFNNNYISTYYKFNEELEDLIELSGCKEEFTRKFRKMLLFLEGLKRNCISHKNFERLVKNGDIYSMRLKGDKNIRILFAFIDYYDKEVSILLYAFEEKDRKTKSKHSYGTAISIAMDRMKELIN